MKGILKTKTLRNMRHLPTPENEDQRIQRLLDLNILDTENEIEFDDLTKIVAEFCDVPICLISLVDKNRQWFKSKIGLDVDETPREISFCQYAIMDEQILEIPDSLEDDRFSSNPLVTGDPKIRFYSGAPLIDNDGFMMGTLCVIDRSPKKLNEFQRSALMSIVKTIMRIMELRRKRSSEELIFQVLL